MLTGEEVLYTLDNYRNGHDPAFVELGHPYVYPIDSRINVFRNEQCKWAIAVEVLGYNPRSEAIIIDITYYGNCLISLEKHEDYFSNSYAVFPIDEESFHKTIKSERLKEGGKFWLVRGQKIELSHSKKDYADAGIELKEYEPDEISAEEVGRFLVTKHRDLFRATDEELYKSIPGDLGKILVIDEWYHRDFYQNDVELPENLKMPEAIQGFDLSQFLEANEGNPEKANEAKALLASITSGLSQYDSNRNKRNEEEWNSNRPSGYETWPLIAKVIETGDVSFYKPTLQPNSH